MTTPTVKHGDAMKKLTVYDAMRRGFIRTYGDLIDKCVPSSHFGTCCACHKYMRDTWQLSTRASICRQCCERKHAQVLGSILNAERKAKRWLKTGSFGTDYEWIAGMCGVSIDFVKAEAAKLKVRK